MGFVPSLTQTKKATQLKPEHWRLDYYKSYDSDFSAPSLALAAKFRLFKLVHAVTDLVGRGDLDDVGHGQLHPVATVTADDQRGALQTVSNGQESALDEVLHVVRLGELQNLLPESGSSRLLSGERLRRHLGHVVVGHRARVVGQNGRTKMFDEVIDWGDVRRENGSNCRQRRRRRRSSKSPSRVTS